MGAQAGKKFQRVVRYYHFQERGTMAERKFKLTRSLNQKFESIEERFDFNEIILLCRRLQKKMKGKSLLPQVEKKKSN
jgi:hypothetical protein